MGRFPWAAFVVVTSIVIDGCSTPFGSDEPDLSLPVAESPASQPSPQSLASQPPQLNPILIPPTDPDQRLRTLKGGRADPFESLIPPGNVPTDSSQSSTKIKASDRSTTAPKAYSSVLGRVGNQFEQRLSSPATQKSPAVEAPTSTSRQTKTARSGSSKLRLPGRPQPNTARGIQVTGIILVAGVPKAIVKIPGETLSQSVRRGECLVKGGVSVIVSQPISSRECLVKGQVLVKQIDLNRPEPVVVLEQYGTEVAIRVGKRPS